MSDTHFCAMVIENSVWLLKRERQMKQKKETRDQPFHDFKTCALEGLAELSFFSNFSEKEIAQILKAGMLLSCASGAHVVCEGERSRDFFVILSGQMVVTKKLYAGDERKIGFIQPGEFFGEMAFLDGLPRSANVACVEAGTVLKLSRESFERLIEKKPRIAYKIAGVIAIALTNRLRKSNDIVEGFFSNPNKAILEFKTRLLKIQTMLQRI